MKRALAVLGFAAALLFSAAATSAQQAEHGAAVPKQSKAASPAGSDNGEYWSRERVARRAEARMKSVVKTLEDAVGRARTAFGE